MSTDRELLENAAKAAGIPIFRWDHDERIDAWMGARADSEEATVYWRPLTDDGDALRLAVKLKLTINPYQEGVFVSRFENEEVVAEPFEVMGIPDAAATRRAIVRAAAAIGAAQ